MRQNGLFSTKNNKKNSDPTPHCPRFAPIPHSKILGTLLSCPVLKMKSRRLCICVSCSDAKYLSTKVLKYLLKYFLGTYLLVLKYFRKLVLST